MMGVRQQELDLFTYSVNLDKRVRPEHPLRQVAKLVDFTFVRDLVSHTYGRNGHRSEDPAVVLKMMFLLFWDDVASERLLMRTIPERLDYLWFLGFGLDDPVPDHSVLSKARRRWGRDAFEEFFVRVVRQCVDAGLVDGAKIHMDGSLVEANASTDSVVRGPPQLISALKKTFAGQEAKLEEVRRKSKLLGEVGVYTPENARLICKTDPDTPTLIGGQQSWSG